MESQNLMNSSDKTLSCDEIFFVDVSDRTQSNSSPADPECSKQFSLSHVEAGPHGQKRRCSSESESPSRILCDKERMETLEEIERQWTQLVRYCPSLDIRIFTCSDEHEMERIAEKWEYIDETAPAAKPARYMPRMKQWDWQDICSLSADSGFRHHRRHDEKDLFFSDRISSQLLYYRITILFGMPPAKETGHKSCWEVELGHTDGASIIRLYDYKGSATVQFCGYASDDGFELINFLVSLDFSWSGTRAGKRL